MRIRLVLAVIAVLAASVLAFTSSAPTSATPGQVPDRFEGSVEDFYVVPDPLPPGEPGELIRVQDVSSDENTTTVRIMYHSRDARDRDRAVTGVVTYPNKPAPNGGWPVISHANGTVGLASVCALSRLGNPVSTLGIDAVGVASDYIGMGPVGETHPYLSYPSEGHSVIDAVRAARNLTETGAGERWLSIGHSQGGHGSIAANEQGEDYAPELELLGTVSLAPASMFERTYDEGGIDDIVSRIVTAMGLYGAESEHPEIDPADYAGPELAQVAAEVFPNKCLNDIINALVPIPRETFFSHDPRTTEPARSIILANDVGNVAVEAPLLLVSGTEDDRVVIERVRDLFDRLCTTGQVTEYTEYPGANHGDIGGRASGQIIEWMNDRLSGAPATDSCGGEPTPPPPTSPTTEPSGPAPSDPVAPPTPPAALPATPVPAAPNYAG